MTDYTYEKCENCAFFRHHYCIDDSGFFAPAHCGHCSNVLASGYGAQKRINYDYGCELWEPKKVQILRRRKNIKDTLKEMERRLAEIAEILELDDMDLY